MYKFCSLWILLLPLSSCFDVKLLNKTCQRSNIKGHYRLLQSCNYTKDIKNQTVLDSISYGTINIMPVVCCPLDDAIQIEKSLEVDDSIHFHEEEIITTRPPSPPTIHTTTNIPLSTTKKPTGPQTIESILTILSKQACGNVTIENRIVGGEITSLYEFPWIVRLKFTRIGYGCAGTLITHRHVLTAAHCLDSRDKLLSVRLGEWDETRDVDCSNNMCSNPPEDRNVSQTIVHPLFSRNGDPTHDIAILVLEEPVEFTEFIMPVCLPISEYVANQDYTNSNSYRAAGWGITEYGTVSTKKRKVSLSSVDYKICRALLNLNPDTRDPFIICAGGVQNKDTCMGDSGGPLIGQVQEDGQTNWYLFGITSTGATFCGQAGRPGVYTRVTKYISWIVNQLIYT